MSEIVTACFDAPQRRKLIRDYGEIICQRCNLICKRHNAPQKYCSTCAPIAKRAATRAWEKVNKDAERVKHRVRCKKWREQNKDKHRLSTNAASVRWQKRNPDKVRRIRKIVSDRRRSTIRGRLEHNVSVAVRSALKQSKSGRQWESLVGYGLLDLISHLERQFSKGISWENYGDWHIDHILPLASFYYTSPEDDQFKAAWALTNLRPLWKIENLKKSNSRTMLI